jgi:putative DNA methylase
MIPKECKRLAEVDFPIAVVSRHSVREKSIRQGHPSTLHLWWARRPLAACRAMLMTLLLPDPADAACPEEFKDAARKGLLALPGAPSRWSKDLKGDEGLHHAGDSDALEANEGIALTALRGATRNVELR